MPQSSGIKLFGSARAVGLAFGKTNAAGIRRAVEAHFGGDWSRRQLLEATDRYRGILAELAPHWLEEIAGIAEGAEVDAEEYCSYQGSKYRKINLPECFTYFAAPQHTAGGVSLFHKNRDNANRPQCAYVKHVDGVFRFAASGDTMDYGCMMAVNERGLCLAADVGYSDPNPCFRGMMNPDIMRLLLERCSTVVEALELLRELDAQKIYAGASTGTNWMISDAGGTVLQVEHYHHQLKINEAKNGFHVMRPDARGKLVQETLQPKSGEIRPRDMNRLARTAPILQPSNISAMTATVPAIRPDLFTRAEFATHHAGRSPHLPLFLGILETPSPLLDGRFYALAEHYPPSPDRIEEIEEKLTVEVGRLELTARSILTSKGELAARKTLTKGNLRLINRALTWLTPPHHHP